MSLADLLLSNTKDPALLSSPQTASYLTHLTTLSLPSLVSEPQTLHNEAATLTSQLTNLCTSEYPTFLSLHAASSELSECLDSFSSSLDSLLDSIPELETQTKEFAQSTKSIQAARRKAALVLEQHDKLLDVLQIPQLIDTCVRNGYYGEAMDLSAHATTLLARFPTIPIIIDVAHESEQAIRLMFSQLLAQLREPAKLPALFRSINFLRRMGSLDEEELALAFLSSRAVYLRGMFDDIETQRTDHARYLRRYVDIFREGLYDVVAQYTTIFLDRAAEKDTDLHSTLLHLLQNFAHTYITQLVATLGGSVPQIEDMTALASLLTQLTYCATSFARIGLDFRGVLYEPFSDAVSSVVSKALVSATSEFVAQKDKKAQTPLSTWFVTPSFLSSLPQQSLPALDNTLPVHVPPNILSSFPPLALYTNAILTALNSLRLLALTALLPRICALLEVSLVRVGRSLLELAPTNSSGKQEAASDMDGSVFTAVIAAYVRCLVPFVERALIEGVYGQSGVPAFEGDELKAMKKDLEQVLSSGGGSEVKTTVDSEKNAET